MYAAPERAEQMLDRSALPSNMTSTDVEILAAIADAGRLTPSLVSLRTSFTPNHVRERISGWLLPHGYVYKPEEVDGVYAVSSEYLDGDAPERRLRVDALPLELRGSDEAILTALLDGAATPQLLAELVGTSRSNVKSRLTRLSRDYEVVERPVQGACLLNEQYVEIVE